MAVNMLTMESNSLEQEVASWMIIRKVYVLLFSIKPSKMQSMTLNMLFLKLDSLSLLYMRWDCIK